MGIQPVQYFNVYVNVAHRKSSLMHFKKCTGQNRKCAWIMMPGAIIVTSHSQRSNKLFHITLKDINDQKQDETSDFWQERNDSYNSYENAA